MSLEVVSLGCRLNLSESEQLRGMLAAASDLTVINSCAVTAEAVRQTRQAIRRARKARPDARLVVTGCAAEIERGMLEGMAEVDALVGNAAKLEAEAYGCETPPPSRTRSGTVPLPISLRETGRNPTGEVPPRSEGMGRGTTAEGGGGGVSRHTRAFVQVQNGCDHDCTFCVIQLARGPSRSRTEAEVLREIESHCAAGGREAVLSGVDLGAWGDDLPGRPRLGKLVSAILDAIPRLTRLRLSSIDGIEIDPLLFELIAGEERVMPHLHLSLQSGDDLMLKRMKRRHTRRDAIQLVEALKRRRPDIAVGADLIAGFPTESEAAHEANLLIVRELGVVHGHIFPYSPRPGTPAARMPQVDAATIKRRAGELRETVAEVRSKWLNSLLGNRLEVLAERDGTGHAPNFARVRLPAGARPGALLSVTPSRIAEGLLA